MPTKTEQNADPVGELADVLREETGKSPAESRAYARQLQTLAARSQYFNLTYCNRPMTARETAESEEVEAAIASLLAFLGIRAELNGDPRGFAVHLFLKSGKSNSWAGCFGIPLSDGSGED